MIRPLLAVAAALTCASLAFTHARQSSLDAVASEARDFVQHYIDTLESGDEDAIRALFIEDDRFAWYSDGELSYSSADEVLAGMQRFAGIQFSTTLSQVRSVPLTTDLVSMRTAFETALTIPGADDYTYGGIITWLLERAPDGGLRVLLGHTSTPGGPPGDGDDGR